MEISNSRAFAAEVVGTTVLMLETLVVLVLWSA